MKWEYQNIQQYMDQQPNIQGQAQEKTETMKNQPFGEVHGHTVQPPTLKFNMGSGNNFIVKNSNIVISSNQNPNGILSPAQHQQALALAQAQAQAQQVDRRPVKKSGSQNRSTNLDKQQKIYTTNKPNPLAAQGLGQPQKFSVGAGFNSTKMRTQRFHGIGQFGQNSGLGQLNTSQTPNVPSFSGQGFNQLPPNNMPNSTNNFQHKQRQLSYSPAAAAAKVLQNKQVNMQGGAKKRNTSENPQPAGSLLGQGIDPLHLGQQIQGRRSQSKNDKYQDQDPNFGGYNQSNIGNLNANMTAQANARFTPAGKAATGFKQSDVMQKRTGGAASRDRAGISYATQGAQGAFNRPASATQKRKNDQNNTGNSVELNPGLRQLLQQNAMQNKDQQKIFQSKIGQNALGRNVGGSMDAKNYLSNQSNGSRMQSQQQHKSGGSNPNAQTDYLNGLINQVQNRQEGANGPNNHMKIQGHILQNIHKRSQSQHANTANQTQKKSSNVNVTKNPSKPSMQPGMFLAQETEAAQQEQGRASVNSQSNHKRPKSNLDGFLNKSKQGPLNANELPQIEVQNRNHQRQTNKTPVVQQSHPVPSKQMPLAQSHDMTASNSLPQQNLQQVQKQPLSQSQAQHQRQAPPPQTQQKNSFYSANPKQMYTNCVTKFAFATKTGISPSNPHKTNQDAWITVPHFCGLKYCHFFAVADGHGQYGREVSSYMKQRLPQFIEAELRFMFQKYNEQLQKNKNDEALNTDEICIAFNNAFLNCNEELFNGNMDIRFSGSTCVSMMTLGQKLFCVNVGDSRGIVVKLPGGDKLIAQAISRDQKPSQHDEATRIINCGGRIDSFRDPDKNPIGPLRVWLKQEDIPGLAMTRSFGDEVASRVGVTAEPEILELDLCKDDKFIVIASDGVWEFITNEEIAKIVKPFFEAKNAEKAAEAVVRESYLRWKREEEGIVDDITCVIVFLDVKLQQQDPSPNLMGTATYEKQNSEKERENNQNQSVVQKGSDSPGKSSDKKSNK